MTRFVVERVQNALNDHSKPVRGVDIHLRGMAYKRDFDEIVPAADREVIVTDQTDVDYKALSEKARVIVEVRNVLPELVGDKRIRL